MAQPLPEIQALLADAAAQEQPDPSGPLEDFRRGCDAVVLRQLRHVRDHGPLHAVRDLQLGGVPVRLYVPADRPALGVHVHLHGGGWWMGSLETVDPMARELAHVSGLAVVSVGYRLAPENPYPAGLQDVLAVLGDLSARTLGFTPTSLSLGGESAGANLTAAACLWLRDHGATGTLPVVAQWLDVPAVDLRGEEDASTRAFGTGFGLEMAHLPLLLGWYGGDPLDPYVSPALAPDLSGLPPAIVTTAELDPVRDQGERYAAALRAAGNDVVLRRNPGQIHASSWLTALTPASAAWYDETVATLVAHHRVLEASR